MNGCHAQVRAGMVARRRHARADLGMAPFEKTLMVKSSIKNRKSSILAVHSGALGDVILFGRLLELLSDSAAVTLLAGGEKARLLAGLGVVKRAMDFVALPMHDIFTDSPADPGRLAKLLGKHDRLVSCFAAGDSRAQMRLAATCGADQAAFLPIRPDEGFQGHLLELWCDLMGAACSMGILPMSSSVAQPPSAVSASYLSVSPSVPRQQRQENNKTQPGAAVPQQKQQDTGKMSVPRFPAWAVPLAWRKKARAALKELGLLISRQPASRPVVIHVGSGAREKCWPLENFISLGLQLVSRDAPRAPVVFVLGPAEIERLDKPLLAQLRKNFPVLEEPPLETLAGVLATCGRYIGNDSGVSHLAAAVGAPTLALFGPTNPRHFAPLGPSVRIVAAENMRAISVQRVWDEVGNVERCA